MAERLRRKIRNLLGFSRAGSSPAGVVYFFSKASACKKYFFQYYYYYHVTKNLIPFFADLSSGLLS